MQSIPLQSRKVQYFNILMPFDIAVKISDGTAFDIGSLEVEKESQLYFQNCHIKLLQNALAAGWLRFANSGIRGINALIEVTEDEKNALYAEPSKRTHA